MLPAPARGRRARGKALDGRDRVRPARAPQADALHRGRRRRATAVGPAPLRADEGARGTRNRRAPRAQRIPRARGIRTDDDGPRARAGAARAASLGPALPLVTSRAARDAAGGPVGRAASDDPADAPLGRPEDPDGRTLDARTTGAAGRTATLGRP